MSAAATVFLAFAMSLDAFAASLGKGAALHRPRLSEALRTGAVFGLIEAATPVLGWMIGLAAAAWIDAVDHWIAFLLLALLGGRMIRHALRREVAARPQRHSLRTLAVTAFATSIDALAVGVTLALIGADIVTSALAIGLATFVMAAIGTWGARFLGQRFGRLAEVASGLCLIGIGLKILVAHTLA